MLDEMKDEMKKLQDEVRVSQAAAAKAGKIHMLATMAAQVASGMINTFISPMTQSMKGDHIVTTMPQITEPDMDFIAKVSVLIAEKIIIEAVTRLP